MQLKKITGKIIEINNENVVYTEHSDGITGLHISKCREFVPQVSDKVEIIISLDDDAIRKI